MRSGNYKDGQRKVIFTLRIRSEHLYTDEVDHITVSALIPSLPLLTLITVGHFVPFITLCNKTFIILII